MYYPSTSQFHSTQELSYELAPIYSGYILLLLLRVQYYIDSIVSLALKSGIFGTLDFSLFSLFLFELHLTYTI